MVYVGDGAEELSRPGLFLFPRSSPGAAQPLPPTQGGGSEDPGPTLSTRQSL